MRSLFLEQILDKTDNTLGLPRPKYTFFGTPVTEGSKILYAVYVENVSTQFAGIQSNMPVSILIQLVEDDFQMLDKMFEYVDVMSAANEHQKKSIEHVRSIPFFINRSRKGT